MDKGNMLLRYTAVAIKYSVRLRKYKHDIIKSTILYLDLLLNRSKYEKLYE